MIKDDDTLRSFVVIPGASAGFVFERDGEIFVDLILVGMGHIIDHFPESWFHGFMRGLVTMGFRDVVFFKKWGALEHSDRDKMLAEVEKIQKAISGGDEAGEDTDKDGEIPSLPENVEEMIH
jgi:hypothetical protein